MSTSNSFFNRPLQLLPVYFKKIGIGVLITTVLVMIALKMAHLNVAAYTKEVIKCCSKDLITLSLMLIAFSKEKVEDELTQLIRMKAIVSAFIFGIVYFIVMDIMNMIIQEPIKVFSAFDFSLQTLFIYLLYYYSAKLLR